MVALLKDEASSNGRVRSYNAAQLVDVEDMRPGMKNARDEVLKVLEANRHTIRTYGAQSLGLFGSVARGRPRQ